MTPDCSNYSTGLYEKIILQHVFSPGTNVALRTWNIGFVVGGGHMSGFGHTAAAAMLIVLGASASSAVQDRASSQSLPQQTPEAATKAPASPAREATVTVFEKHEIQAILGKELRSAASEDMGRVVDVLVDGDGQVAAAIIDFGGFLGLGSRKVAVAWNALHFPPGGSKGERIALELTRDQVRAAPEFKEDRPVVVLGASGNLESLPYQ
jgi:PRC-barrel domain